MIKENYLNDVSGARYSYSAILSSGNDDSFADEAQIGIAQTYEKEHNHLFALQEYERFQKIYPGADQAREIAARIAFIKKFRKIDPAQENQIVNDFLLRQATESPTSDLVAKWVKQQIHVFHDYEQALALLKAGYSQKGAELFPRTSCYTIFPLSRFPGGKIYS